MVLVEVSISLSCHQPRCPTITIITDSGAKRAGPGDFCRVSKGSKIQDLEEKDHAQCEERLHTVAELATRKRDQGFLASVNKIYQRTNRAVFDEVQTVNIILTRNANGIGYEADQEHAAGMVNKNLTSKDRPVSTLGEDMDDNVNESDLSAPAQIIS